MKILKHLFVLLIIIAASGAARAQFMAKDVSDPAVTAMLIRDMPLYEKGAPQSNGLEGKEHIDRDNRQGARNIVTPLLQVYIPKEGSGRAVIICPGGGYSGLAIGHEGAEVAEWFNQQGIAAIVLYYRMPNGHREIPLADVHEAMGVVRKKSAEWGIDPAKIGVMGFSAGGHLASTATVRYGELTRPAFSILIYPVISLSPQLMHQGTRDNLLGKPDSMPKEVYDKLVAEYSANLNIRIDTPPVFIAFSDDDTVVPPMNGTLMYDALKTKGIPGELHIYPSGGHGWGWRENFKYRDELLVSLSRWLKDLP